MIEICTETLSVQYLKEDIGHFRNVVQHTNMSLLDAVLKTLKSRANDIIKKTEE